MVARCGMALCVLIGGVEFVAAADDSSPRVVATVNGEDITQADLDAEYLIRRIPAEKQAQFRESVLTDLVDRRLIAAFLDQRKAPVPEPELDTQIELLKRAVETDDNSFNDVVAKLGLTEETLRAHLALPLRWKTFVRRTVTDQELRDYFDSRRAEFDGTQVRASQIVISVPADADEAAWTAAQTKLGEVRQSIVDGKLSFADAARLHSTSPSGKLGGDLGFFGYLGRLPAALSAAAFALQPDQLSEVIRTKFGVHLLQVTERKAGDYSLEDVRDEVWAQRSREFWNEQVAEARRTARIRLTSPKP